MDPPAGGAAEASALHRELQSLRQSVKQLSALNELAREVGAARDLEEIMRTLIRRTLRLVGASQGVITLINEAGSAPMQTLIRTRLTTSTNQTLRPDEAVLGWLLKYKRPLLINDPQQDERFRGARWDPSIRSLLCVPLMIRSTVIGILTLYNKHGETGFTREDERLLFIIASQSAQVIESTRLLEERNRVLGVFGQHVSPAIVEELLKTGTEFASRRQYVCLLFLDIRGFTTYAENRPPEEVVAYLNTVFDFMIDAVNRHHGIVHRLLGDGFVALFGAPFSLGNDRRNAVDAAQAILAQLEAESAAGAIPPTRVGIGIHAGEVVAGTVGSASRREYQVNGDVVNLAARIEQMNKDFGSQLLISEEVWKALDPARYRAQALGPLEVRGRSGTVRLYRLA